MPWKFFQFRNLSPNEGQTEPNIFQLFLSSIFWHFCPHSLRSKKWKDYKRSKLLKRKLIMRQNWLGEKEHSYYTYKLCTSDPTKERNSSFFSLTRHYCSKNTKNVGRHHQRTKAENVTITFTKKKSNLISRLLEYTESQLLCTWVKPICEVNSKILK